MQSLLQTSNLSLSFKPLTIWLYHGRTKYKGSYYTNFLIQFMFQAFIFFYRVFFLKNDDTNRMNFNDIDKIL